MTLLDVRPATEADRALIFAICERISDHDYIPEVWEEWLQDPHGVLLVATADGQPVGMIHFTMVTDKDGWLEGIRVDPDYRRQGIARMLHQHATLEALRREVEYLRLTVESTNEAAIALIEGLPMRHVGSFVSYHANLNRNDLRPINKQLQLATLEDLDTIIDYLNNSSIFPLIGGLYYHNYMARPITGQFLEEKIASQHIWLLQRWERLDGLVIVEPDQQALAYEVGYIDGLTIEAISMIMYELRHRLSIQEYDLLKVTAPDMVMVHDALEGMGYEARDIIFHIYERGLF